jgi:hypothetical protein
MRYQKLFKLANLFYSLASKEAEELPSNYKNLKTILSNVDKLETYKAKVEYCEKNLKHLSSGSSRITFITPSNTVIKLAKNDKGIAQNKAEANTKMKSKFLNKILDKSKDYNWIEVEYLDKITESEFEDLTGVNFKTFGKCLKYLCEKSSGKKPKELEECKDSEVIKEMVRLCKDFDLLYGDIERISSWGCKDDKVILIDSGLTGKVYATYYSSGGSSSSS